MFFLFLGFPHIHGVAWIDESWLNKNGIKDGILSEATDQAVCDLADKLISCEVPEPGPEPDKNAPEDVKHRYARDKMLNKTVPEVQKHHHTNSCRKYNGTCRYNFPKFPCKKTILATPKVLKYSNEEEKKKRESEIEKNNKKYGEILKDAKELLDDGNLEERILKKIWEPSFDAIVLELLDEIYSGKNLPDDENTEKGIVRKVVRTHYTNDTFDGDHKQQIIDEAFEELKKKKIQAQLPIEINEDDEMEAFCKIIHTSYEEYEKALSTTKKGKVLY